YGKFAVELPPAKNKPISLAVASLHGPLSLSVAPSPSPFHREVFGFAPYWSLGQSSQWDFRLLTTVAYFGLTINRDAGIDTAAPGYNQFNSQAFTDIINIAHTSGDRVVLVIKQFNTEAINRIVTDPSLTQVGIN